MTVAAPKIAVHLYLNNPYGLISATIPNFVINRVKLDDDTSPSADTDPRKENKNTNVESLGAVKTSVPETKVTLKPEVTQAPDQSVGKKWKPLPEIKSEPSYNSSCDYNPPTATVFFAKSPVQRQGGNSNLGFTWSVNLDKREKMVFPRQPPPPSILEKLGRLKIDKNIGKPKIKKKKRSESKYLIKRLEISDKGQRKMSEKLSEWLDQYTEVSQKQQDYLSRIHELRRGLEHKEDKHVLATIENMRGQQKEKYRRKYPLYSLTRMEGAPVNHGPAPFPNRQSLFHDNKHGIPKLKIAPHTSPRKLAPLVKRVNGKYTVTKDENNTHQVTPRPEMATMRTEYETFESIAKRNKLNLTQFFNSSLSHRRSHQRLPMSVSTVTIIDEIPEEDAEQKAFITDLSSRKPVITNGLKDQKPG